MVLRSGTPLDAGLAPEFRNVAADFLKVKGVKPTSVAAIAIMSDADDTGSSARGRISLPRFTRCDLAS
jgi:hypothetical protein